MACQAEVKLAAGSPDSVTPVPAAEQPEISVTKRRAAVAICAGKGCILILPLRSAIIETLDVED
jgi:hypothetical protein